MCFEDDLLNILIVGNVDTKSFDVFRSSHIDQVYSSCCVQLDRSVSKILTDKCIVIEKCPHWTFFVSSSIGQTLFTYPVKSLAAALLSIWKGKKLPKVNNVIKFFQNISIERSHRKICFCKLIIIDPFRIISTFLFFFLIFKKYKICIQKFKKNTILIPSKIISSFEQRFRHEWKFLNFFIYVWNCSWRSLNKEKIIPLYILI